MKKLFYVIIFAMPLTSVVQANMTVGSTSPPDVNALLDLKEPGTTTKGLLLPRVHLVAKDLPDPMTAHVAGMIVYNDETSLTTVVSENRVSPGYYYNTGSRWEKLRLEETNWFYMPSIVIDVSSSGNFTRDLYLEYRKQFEDTMDNITSPSSPAVGMALIKSPNAPNPLTNLLNANELYYYITGYDNTVFSALSITEDGKLSYTVNSENVTEATYMNIVFVEK